MDLHSFWRNPEKEDVYEFNLQAFLNFSQFLQIRLDYHNHHQTQSQNTSRKWKTDSLSHNSLQCNDGVISLIGLSQFTMCLIIWTTYLIFLWRDERDPSLLSNLSQKLQHVPCKGYQDIFQWIEGPLFHGSFSCVLTLWIMRKYFYLLIADGVKPGGEVLFSKMFKILDSKINRESVSRTIFSPSFVPIKYICVFQRLEIHE